MALLLIAVPAIAYLVAVFVLAGASPQRFLRVLENLWRSGIFS
jgi:hypothetical protein